MRRSPLAVGIAASLALHLLLVGVLLLPRSLFPPLTTKRGDSLYIELEKPEETARPGAPTAPAPKAAPAPPAPRVATAPPQPKAAPSRPEPRASEQPASPTRPPAVRESPAPPPAESATPPAESPQVAAAPPAVPAPPPEAGPREAAPNRTTPHVAVAPAPEPREAAPDIRSALRRGGPGGAGGLGKVRGGIVGDPISLNTKDSRYRDYLLQIKRMIEANMVYPCIRSGSTRECEMRPARLSVEFGILRDGRLQFVEVVVGAPHPDFDDYSVTAIKLASPFPPVPASLMATLKPGTTGMPILAQFVYEVETSWRSLVR